MPRRTPDARRQTLGAVGTLLVVLLVGEASITTATASVAAIPADNPADGRFDFNRPFDPKTVQAPLGTVPTIESPASTGTPLELPAGAESTGVEIQPDGEESVISDDRTHAAPERTEVLSERSADRRVFERADGTRDVEFYATPRSYQDDDGNWKLIDTRISSTPGDPNVLASTANSWTATFATAGEGMLSLDTADGAFGWDPADAEVVTPAVDGESSTATYAGVWEDVSLAYTVGPSTVTQNVVVATQDASARFAFALHGATARLAEGAVYLAADGHDYRMSLPLVTDAAGNDVSDVASPEVQIIGEGTEVQFTVDQDWLTTVPEDAFPLSVTSTTFVTIAGPWAVQAQSFSNTGATYVNEDLLKIGRDSAGRAWRARVHFDYEQYLRQQSGQKYRVIGASMAVQRDASDQQTAKNGRATPYVATGASFAGAAGRAVDNGWGAPPTLYENGVLNVMTWGEATQENWLSRLVNGWFDAETSGMWLGLMGDEVSNGTMHTYWPRLSLQLAAPPPPTTLSSPISGTLLASTTPTLVAQAVNGVTGVFHRFEVSTARGGGAASVVSSGWTPATQWTVPDHALLDGGTYFARVHTAFDITDPDLPSQPRWTSPLPSDIAADREFRIDLKLGSGGVSPTEAAGSVAGVTGTAAEGAPTPSLPGAAVNVNLVNGNAAVSVPTSSVATVSGAIAPSLVYNSRGASSAGLVGEYFADPSRQGAFDGSAVSKRAERIDSILDFDWLTGEPPVESIPSGPFLARWNGHVSLPSSGSWQLGLAVTDWHGTGGARLYIGGEASPAVNAWSPPRATGWEMTHLSSARTFTAGARVPIRVELRGEAGQASIRLIAKQGNTTYIVQPSWLTQSNPALPDGWQLATGAGGVAWLGLADLGDAVVIRAADGSSHGFRRTSSGGYTPPEGSNDHLTVDVEGRFSLQTGNGLTYTFRADGQLDRVTSVADDRTPARPVFGYTGTTPRLTTITDPVSSRTVQLKYAPQGCAAPQGMLCRIEFWNGTTSVLSYDGSGRLTRVANAGSSTGQPLLFDFGYDAQNALTSVRDPLAADLIAAGRRPNTEAVRTVLTYDGAKRMTTVTKPEPRPGETRTRAEYRYPASGVTEVVLEGFEGSDPGGWARRVEYDSRGRITKDTASSGLTTSYLWDQRDRLLARIDPAQLKTSYGYDSAGRITDTWGPAPANRFDSSHRPVSGADVPRARTDYDGGMSDLAVSYWSNGTHAGSPVRRATGLPGVTFGSTWSTPPLAAGSDGRWSFRATGEIRFPARGTYALQGGTSGNGEFRVWIDDRLVIETTRPSNTAAITLDDENWHRIRVDFRSASSGTSSLSVSWRGPGIGAGGNFQQISDAALRPAYGLPTRSIDPDGLVTDTLYSDPDRHIGPEYGLATGTVADPNGLALTTRLGFEDPTLGGFLRQTTRTLPAGNQWATSYYAGSEGPTAAACGVPAVTAQGGLPKQRTGPEANDGSRRTEQYIYDSGGRTVGTRTGTVATIASTAWSCTLYDDRGRLSSQTMPLSTNSPAATTTYSYRVGGDPLVSAVSASSYSGREGEIVSEIDLAGRTRNYTAGGLTTVNQFDRVGRITSSTGPGGSLSYTYEARSGRLEAVSMGGEELARNYFNPSTGRLTATNYGNETTSLMAYDAFGRSVQRRNMNSAGTNFAAEKVELTAAGRVRDYAVEGAGPTWVDPNPAGANVEYDGAGRVIRWHGVDGVESYGYGAALCGSALAGQNTNRTSVTTVDGTRTYCYDAADRLVVGGAVTDIAYDPRGNISLLNDQQYSYDPTGRMVWTAGDSRYTWVRRDAVNRVIRHEGNFSAVTYGYTGLGDEASYLKDSTGAIVERYVALPGGVKLALSNGSERWAFPDLGGDIVASVDGDGIPIAERTNLTPWGEGRPADSRTGPYQPGFLGSAGRLTETNATLEPAVDLGARTYHPGLGRFLSVDPVVGGCANDYVYVYGDPVNSSDPNGTQSCANFHVTTQTGVVWGTTRAGARGGLEMSLMYSPLGFEQNRVGIFAAQLLIKGPLGATDYQGPISWMPGEVRTTRLPAAYRAGNGSGAVGGIGTMSISVSYLALSLTPIGEVGGWRTIDVTCEL